MPLMPFSTYSSFKLTALAAQALPINNLMSKASSFQPAIAGAAAIFSRTLFGNISDSYAHEEHKHDFSDFSLLIGPMFLAANAAQTEIGDNASIDHPPIETLGVGNLSVLSGIY